MSLDSGSRRYLRHSHCVRKIMIDLIGGKLLSLNCEKMRKADVTGLI